MYGPGGAIVPLRGVRRVSPPRSAVSARATDRASISVTCVTLDGRISTARAIPSGSGVPTRISASYRAASGADVIRGREVTTVAKCKFDCEFSGGKYVDREVVVSGNLVTARTWHDNPAWMREFLRLLRDKT